VATSSPLNSSQTIEALTDEEGEDQDILAYHSSPGRGVDPNKSFTDTEDGDESPKNVLRPSNHGVFKPKMNPKSPDSDYNDSRIFS